MKSSIEWHKNCLKNSEKSLVRKKRELEMLEQQVARDEQQWRLYSAQIELAEKEGKDGFDAEKYAIKRLCI